MERRLHKHQMNSPSGFKADKFPGIYAKDRSGHRSHPFKERRIELLKKAEKTAVLIVAPQTGRLPEGMGHLARYIQRAMARTIQECSFNGGSPLV